MHGPTGISGEHAFPKRGHSVGMMMPHRSSPQRHPLCSFGGGGETGNFRDASKSAYSSLISSPEAGITPSPRHALSAGSKTSYIIFTGAFVSGVLHDPRIFIQYLGAAIPTSFISISVPEIKSWFSNPATTPGL